MQLGRGKEWAKESKNGLLCDGRGLSVLCFCLVSIALVPHLGAGRLSSAHEMPRACFFLARDRLGAVMPRMVIFIECATVSVILVSLFRGETEHK